MALSEAIRAYRVQWAEGHAVREVVATLDRAGSAVTVTVPDGAAFTVTTIAARAVSMILSDAVYRVLEPAGPFLTIEINTGTGWHDLRRVSR